MWHVRIGRNMLDSLKYGGGADGILKLLIVFHTQVRWREVFAPCLCRRPNIIRFYSKQDSGEPFSFPCSPPARP